MVKFYRNDIKANVIKFWWLFTMVVIWQTSPLNKNVIINLFSYEHITKQWEHCIFLVWFPLKGGSGVKTC